MKKLSVLWKPLSIVALMGILLTGCHSWHHHGHHHNDGYRDRHDHRHHDRHDRRDRHSDNGLQADPVGKGKSPVA